MALKPPSQTKAFGLGVPKVGRKTSQFKAMAFKITLKTPSGDEEIECDGAPLLCYAAVLHFIIFATPYLFKLASINLRRLPVATTLMPYLSTL